MRKFTQSERINGEFATRNLSKKAMCFVENSSPLIVYEYYDLKDKDNKRYAYNLGGDLEVGLTFEELQKHFESYYNYTPDNSTLYIAEKNNIKYLILEDNDSFDILVLDWDLSDEEIKNIIEKYEDEGLCPIEDLKRNSNWLDNSELNEYSSVTRIAGLEKCENKNYDKDDDYEY